MAARGPKGDAPGGASAADVLRVLRMIDKSLDAFCATAPKAVAAMGGRDAIKRLSEMTCIGPVPRLDVTQWAAMSAEHMQSKRDAFENTLVGVGGKAEAADRRGLSPSYPSVRSRGLSR